MHRILVVEDEEVWHDPMLRAWAEVAKAPPPHLAVSAQEALDMSRDGPWHVVSLDMRLPQSRGLGREVDVGVDLTKVRFDDNFPSKLLVYSITLDVEMAQSTHEGVTNLGITASVDVDDKFAKAGTSAPARPGRAWSYLSPYGWAQQVLAYVKADTLSCPDIADPKKQRLSAIGAWLERAPKRLPPFLAALAQDLANHWDRPGSDRVEAALRFVEGVAKLALVQSAVLLQHSPGPAAELQALLPSNGRHAHTLKSLNALYTSLLQHWPGCNWLKWLTTDCLAQLETAHDKRNQMRHSFKGLRHLDEWRDLYPSLRVAMDLASYWALHPLCVNLRLERGGWHGQTLTSTAWPTAKIALERGAVPPDDVETSEQAWQFVWQRSSTDQPWVCAAVPWADWLHKPHGSDEWWLFLWQRAGHASRQAQQERLGLYSAQTQLRAAWPGG